MTGTFTAGDLAVATGLHSLGNFGGSDPGACVAGQADTHPALSATGTLSKSCAVFVNAAGTGLSLSGSTLSLPNTGPGANSYTYASLTLDVQGRVTAASSGAAPALAATTITAGTMLSGGGDLSANRTINLADIATSTVIGRVAAGTGAPSALTTTQLTTLVNPFTSTLSGAVPASGGSSTAFLNGAGGWTVPAGTGATGTGTTNTLTMWSNTSGGLVNSPVIYDGSALVSTLKNLQVGGSSAATLNVINVAGSGFPATTYGTAAATVNIIQPATNNGLVVTRAAVDAVGGKVSVYKTRSADASVPVAVANADELGRFSMAAATDGTAANIKEAARIGATVSGTVSAGVVPTSMTLSTTNASGTLTTALTLGNDQSAAFAASGTFGGTNAATLTVIDIAAAGVPANMPSGAAAMNIVQPGGAGLLISRPSASASAPRVTFYKTRSTDNTRVAVANGDPLGDINFVGASDGTTDIQPAGIKASVTGAVSSGSIPTGLFFYTGTTSATQALALNSDQSATFAGQVDLGSHKIVNLTNGASAQDAAAFGQIASAVSAAGLSGGTAGRVAVYNAPNSVIGYAGFTSDASGNVTVNALASGQVNAVVVSGSAALVAGTSTKSWTWYPNGNDLNLFEYTTTVGAGGGNVRATFKSGGGLDVASAKITSCANGTISTDGACFGQLATAVNAAVSGTVGRSARFSSTNVVGTGALTDDGTNITASAGTVQFSSTLGVTGALTASSTAHVVGAITADSTLAVATTSIAGPNATINGTATTYALKVQSGTASGLTAFAGVGGIVLDGTSPWISINGTTGKGFFFGNSSASTDGAVSYDNSAARTLSLQAGGVDVVDVTSATTTVKNALTQTAGNVAFNTTSGTTAITGHGATDFAVADATTGIAGDAKMVSSTNTATFNTTASNRNSYGEYVSVANSISAGANQLSTIAGYFTNTSSGANINAWALYTDSGDVRFNVTSGAANFKGSTTVDNSLFINGKSGVATNVTSNFSQTAQTVQGIAGEFDNTGTFNTTSGVISAYGVRGSATSTRSSGANNLTNIGVYGTASGAQKNYAAYFDGDSRVKGHDLFNTAGAPTGSGCTLDANSTDAVGVATFTSGATTLCTVTFNTAFPVTPMCVCSKATNAATTEVLTDCEGASTTTMTMHATTSTSAGVFAYRCSAHE